MTPSVWSGGHIGWPLFGILVFSALCVVATDIVWRTVRMPFRSLFLCAAGVWAVGIAIALVFFFT